MTVWILPDWKGLLLEREVNNGLRLWTVLE